MNFYHYVIGWRLSIHPVALKRTIMRIQLVLLSLFVLILQLQAHDLKAQRLTLHTKQMSLENVLKEITSQTKYDFLYNPELLKKDAIPVTISAQNMALDETLVQIFESQPNLSYTIDQKTVVIRPKKVSTNPNKIREVEMSQQTIRGQVTNEKGESMPGVSIQVKGSTVGSVSSSDGRYTIVIPDGNNILVFSYIGYATQEVTVSGQTEINVVLKEQSSDVDEVVVVGYGTLSRRSVTSAISNLDGKELESKPINTVGDGLKGKIAGVRVYSTDNQPGVGPTFRIRGGSSINKSNSPLVLVDGVERDIVGLNPNDIESISALKDAASTAIYGAKASNGVIMITTKKGIVRTPTITFDASTAYQEKAQGFKTMSSEDFIRTMRTAVAEGKYPERNFANNYAASSANTENSIYTTRYLEDGEVIPEGYKSMSDPLDPSKTLVFQDNNFMDRYFRPNMWQNYYVGALGGDNRVKYNFSLGYTDDDGIAVATGYKRVTVHGNTEFKITDNLSLEGGYDYSENVTEDLPDNKTTFLQRTFSIPNVQRVFWPDTGLPVHSINKTTVAPDWYEYYYSRGRTQKYSTAIAALTWQPINDLKIVAKGTNSDRYSRYNGFIKETNYKDPRSASATFTSTTRRNFQAYANYFKTFSEIHNINLMAGTEYQLTISDGLSAAAEGGASDLIPTLTAQPTITAAASGQTSQALLSYFGRANYSLKNRYLFSTTLRADGSSIFAPQNRWGYFPSVSAAWILSDENFMQGLDVVNSLKLRTSLGQTGNNAIDLFDATGSYNVDNKYDGNAALYADVMGNENLKWETTTQFDLGLDIEVLKRRISFSADYYNKVTNDLILSMTLPNTTGFNSVNINTGSVKFYGFDFELHTRNIETQNFSWTTDFTYSYNKNKILKLPENGLPQNRMNGRVIGGGYDYIGGYAEGESLGELWGYKVKGILETPEQADNAYYDTRSLGFRYSDGASVTGRKAVGDYEWLNREGSTLRPDGSIQIDDEDQFLLGYTIPHTTGGVGNTFTYKNLSLYVFLDYQIGSSMFNYQYGNFFKGTFAYNYNLHEDVMKSWTQPGDDTKFAKFFANDADDGNRNYGRTADIMVQKADFLCLRDVTLSYDLTLKSLEALKIKRMNLYLSGANLFYFTELIGLSPENAVSTTNNASYSPYPTSRRFSVGAKLTF